MTADVWPPTTDTWECPGQLDLSSPPIAGVHPYAEKFPMLPQSELAELAESIRANGLRQPIVVTPDGLILDGRNRFAACTEVGIEAARVIYEGDDLAEYVIDANSSRRHMSTGARAMATALVLVADGRRSNGRWVGWSRTSQDSGKSSGEREALRQSGVVLDFAPDLAESVVSGDLALDAAFRRAEQRRDAERQRLEEQQRRDAEEADARAFIEENAPDLATRVDGSDLLTYVEARDLWNRRNREEAERLRREKETAERKAAEERRARSDLYSGIAKCVQTAAVYGQYEDVPKLMADFDPAELNPPQYEREFRAANLRAAARFMTELIEWAEARA